MMMKTKQVGGALKQQQFPPSDDETEREAAARSKARGYLLSSRLPLSPPSTSSSSSSSSSSRKLLDDLSDFIAIFHAAKQRQTTQRIETTTGTGKRGRETHRHHLEEGEEEEVVVGGGSGVRKWFAQLSVGQRQAVLSHPLDKSSTEQGGNWALLLYELLLLREEKGCDRFLLLGDVLKTVSSTVPSAPKAKPKPNKKKKSGNKNKKKSSNRKKASSAGSGGERERDTRKVEEVQWNSFRAKARDAICWRRSSDLYKRLLRCHSFERQLEEKCFLYCSGSNNTTATSSSIALFDSFGIDESLLSDLPSFYKLCEEVSLGQFRTREEEKKSDGLPHETERLLDMGYHTISALVVSKVEMQIRKAYRSHQKGIEANKNVNKRETLSSEQQELVTALSRKCLARQMHGQVRNKAEQLRSNNSNTCEQSTLGCSYLDCLRSFKDLQEGFGTATATAMDSSISRRKKEENLLLCSGRFYLCSKPDLRLDRMLLISQSVALDVVTKWNEALLLRELDEELTQREEEEERKKKKKKAKKDQQRIIKQQQQLIEKQKKLEKEKEEKEKALQEISKEDDNFCLKETTTLIKVAATKNTRQKVSGGSGDSAAVQSQSRAHSLKEDVSPKKEKGGGNDDVNSQDASLRKQQQHGDNDNAGTTTTTTAATSDCPVRPPHEEEEKWMEAYVPAEANFSWANIFGAAQPGASFYWSSGDTHGLNMYNMDGGMQHNFNQDRDGSETSWTSSTRQEFVLGSLLSNLEQNDVVLSSPERKPLGLNLNAAEAAAAGGDPSLSNLERFQHTPSPDLSLSIHSNRDGRMNNGEDKETASVSSDHARPTTHLNANGPTRSETNSPRFSTLDFSARRPSLELSTALSSAVAAESGGNRQRGNPINPQGGMGRWLLQRRSSEVMLLSRAEPANSATSFLMSSAPPRSLLRTMLNAFGPPSADSPYRSEYNERKSFWLNSKSATAGRDSGFPLGLKKLDRDIEVFVNKVLENQRRVSRHQREAMKQILDAIHVIWPRARAKVFGSVAAGLSLPGSDMDIVLWLPPVRNSLKNILEVGILESGNETKESFVQQLARHLKTGRYSWINQDSLRVIDKTAIPILSVEYSSCESKDSSITGGGGGGGGKPSTATATAFPFRCSIDISFQNKNHKGVLAAAIVRELTSIFPQLASLTYVLKAFLQGNNLSKAYTGGLSSYSLTLIISSFLIHHQNTQEKKKKKETKTNSSKGDNHKPQADHHSGSGSDDDDDDGDAAGSSIGQLLLDFLHLFGSAFNTRTFSCSLSKGISRISEDNPQRFDPIFVEDPLQPGKNAAQNCFRITQIQNQMQKAYTRAQEILNNASDSGSGGGNPDEGDLLKSIFRCNIL
jgi:non-canonical poly(A) RNA polymerase PAPD5/7